MSEPIFCGDCKHPAHSGPCPVLHFYDRPGEPPGNQQCHCGHPAIQQHIKFIPDPRIAQLESELAALRETRQKDYEASVAALKATGLYGEHDNDSLSVLGAFDALQLRLTALRKERNQLRAALDEQLAIFNRSRTQWKKGYDALKVNLDAAIKLLRELQLPLMPFALLDKIEKFLKELEER